MRWTLPTLFAVVSGCRLSPEPVVEVPSEPVGQRVLLESAEGRPVHLRIYPGQVDEVALVLAGVHGNERSAMELCAAVEGILMDMKVRSRTTMVVPVLFPDLAAAGVREDAKTPTNRNFPKPGEGPQVARRGHLLDAMLRPVLPENVALMELMAEVEPDRVLALHATHRLEAAGVFADPHPRGPDGRTDEAHTLALSMAGHLADRGQLGLVRGNDLDGMPHALWSGSVKGGVSLGSWGPVAISEGGDWDRRDAMVLTVELPGYEGTDGRPDRQAAFDEMAAVVVEVGLR